MCTIGLLFRAHPTFPLVVAQSRDELFARPTEPVHRWTPDGADRPIVAGRDQASGGTWFAVSRSMVVGITNHRAGERSPPGARSRGELVTRAATADDPAAARAWLEDQPGDAFGPFHLLLSDGRELLWATNAEGPLEVRPVEPGAHVLRNSILDDAEDAVGARVRERLLEVKERPLDDAIAGLQALLAEPAPEGPCVDLGVFGTRSAGVLFWGAPGARYVVTPGSPREGGWADRSELLADLSED